MARGFEPDTGFYIQHAEQVHGKEEIDLDIDPPPDLVIEIDITHSTVDKLSLYAAMGIAEVWRFDGRTLTILVLENGAYRGQASRSAFAGLGGAMISEFVDGSRTTKRTEWLRQLRARVRTIR